MSGQKSNPEYEQMKAKAPHILAEMVQMLITWRKMGFHVPRGVRNIFEFTWDEFMVSLPKTSFRGLYCPIIKFISHCEETLSSHPTASRVHKMGPVPSEMQPNYVTPSLENQQMLLRFQQRSVHLLSELLKMKMKIMIDAVAGPNTKEAAKRLLEYSQQLAPRTQEEATEFMTRDPRKKGLLKSKTSSQDSSDDERLDPCPQAKEKLREICQQIEQEKIACTAKGHTRPLILRNYITVYRSPSMALKRFPTSPAADVRRGRGRKFYFAFPDGTSFMFYPSGSVAVCQFPICCLGKTITLVFHNDPGHTLLGSFLSQGQSYVRYSFQASCSIALLMDQEGGTIRDTNGYLTNRWSWYSKEQKIESLEFQITEHLNLKVLSQHSMTLTFTSLTETISLSLARARCPHKLKTENWLSAKSNKIEETAAQWSRVLAEIKKRFEKTVKQFINGVLMASGICCVDYPVGESSKQVRFSLKEPFPQAWDRKLREAANASIVDSKGKLGKPGAKVSFPGSNISVKASKEKPKHVSRAKNKTAEGAHPVLDTWASCPADCPIVLRRILAKEQNADAISCKCVVKIPLVTDLEFEKFITAPRNPQQIIVICVLSLQNHSYSTFFEWSLEKIYIQMQHGRPSPCVQSKRDPFRLVKYDLDCPMNNKPPLLVQKHGVIPGMVVMYAGRNLLFGGCIFNGYSYSKKDLLKQINQVRLNCKMGHFLPQSFKFSGKEAVIVEMPTVVEKIEEVEEAEEEKEKKPKRPSSARKKSKK